MSTTMSSLFCFNPSPDSKYAPGSTTISQNEYMKPLIPRERKRETTVDQQYPGIALRTAALPNDCSPPENTTLIKTGGNALQAVDNSILEQDDLVAVTIPDKNLKAGDTLLVVSPDGSRAVSARIPEGHDVGSVFFVQFAAPAVVAVGVPLSSEPQLPIVQAIVNPSSQSSSVEYQSDLQLAEETDERNRDLVLVTVPESSLAGDRIRVRLPDQRVVEAVVPEGNVKQFYVQAPPHVNNGHLPAIV
eukprot:CAMPEP_0119009424 /NCGR_PEP_ID=MMETSP1176-20130426/4353_1 /TAXON_ID=265551 /ORGANISM="Synedropsis recta cf, Strain CCMP1620" /LENGTH=245 /DNA_ID=CAMNT_0006961937 /DNA_START=51 /DNA_END=788 /DNA_ORIENTATION=-